MTEYETLSTPRNANFHSCLQAESDSILAEILNKPTFEVSFVDWTSICRACEVYWLGCHRVRVKEDAKRQTLQREFDKLKKGFKDEDDYTTLEGIVLQVGQGIIATLRKMELLKAEAEARQRREKEEKEAAQRQEQEKKDRQRREKEEEYQTRLMPEQHPNFLLPLYWILTKQPEAASLQLSGAAVASICSNFEWCVGFCEAFYAGPQKLVLWLHKHGVGCHLKLRKPATKEAKYSFLQSMKAYLNSAYECRRSASETLPEAGISVQYVDSQENHGVNKVMMTLDGRPGSMECVALIVKVPTHGLPVDSEKAPDSTAEATKPAPPSRRLMSVKIRGAIPQLRDIQLTDVPEAIEYEEIILTLPRLHFLLVCSESAYGSGCGLQLAGVHGTGKSTMLRALVGMLCVGSGVDSWFEADAREVFRRSKIPPILRSSTGAAMQHTRSNASPEAVRPIEQWVAGLSDPSADKWVDTYKSFFHHDMYKAVSGPKLIVFDEVNKVIRARRDKQLEFLQYDHNTSRGTLKIFAASPDGPRERACGEFEPTFFELRPPPALHMASVLSAAPQAFGRCVPVSLQLDVATMVPQCQLYASNMRQLSLTLRKTFESPDFGELHTDSPGPDFYMAFDEASIAIRKAYISKLTDRMAKPVDKREHPAVADLSTKFGADSTPHKLGLLLLHMTNASLLVRRDATKVHSKVDLVGSIAYTVHAHASKVLYDRVKQGAASALQLEDLKSALDSVLTPDTDDGYQFESQIACRLYLRLLSERAILMSQLGGAIAQYKAAPSHKKTASASFGYHASSTKLAGVIWNCSGEDDSTLPNVVFVSCSTPSTITREVMAAIQACKDGPIGGTLVIQTADSAPFCDFVVLTKSDSGFKVVFVEATVSTLYKHASGKTQGMAEPSSGRRAKQPRSGVAQTAAARALHLLLECPCSMEDIGALVAQPKYDIQRDGSAVKLHANTVSGASVSNTWLDVLGARCRLDMQAHRSGSDTFYHVTQVSTSPGGGAAATRRSKQQETATKQWDIVLLYVSGKHLKEQCAEGLGKLVCDFAYCLCSEHLTVGPEKLFSRPNSPVKLKRSRRRRRS